MQYKYPILVLEKNFLINKTGGLNHCKDREENRTWCNINLKTNMLKPEFKKSLEESFWLLDMFKRLVFCFEFLCSEKSLLILLENCFVVAFSLFHVGYCRRPTAYRLAERFPKVRSFKF